MLIVAASDVDRILRGAKPGDLPGQFPTKFEMVVSQDRGGQDIHTPDYTAAR
jgi:hypothetical protein